MQDESLEAKKKAMSLLKYMDRTEWQLRDKLSLKGFSELYRCHNKPLIFP